METHGWTEENFAETGVSRGLALSDVLERLASINATGMTVRLRALPLPWSWHDLVEIQVSPRRGFVHLATQAKVVNHYHQGHFYHLSLCKRSDLGPDGAAAYRRIRHRYDGEAGVLSVSISNSAANLTSASDLSRRLLDDPDIALLHGGGVCADRPLHVSL
jgi:hypothetical protein